MNNKGFTLIEMLVSLAVSSMIMLGLVVFMSASSKSYKMTNDEVTVQTEAQNTMNIIRNLVMQGCQFEYNKKGVTPEAGVDTSILVTEKTYLAFKTDVTDTTINMNYIVYDSGKLYYLKKEYTLQEGFASFVINRDVDITSAVSNDNLMADYIKEDGFTIKLNKEKIDEEDGTTVLRNVYVELAMEKNQNSMIARETIKPRNEEPIITT